MWGGARDVGCGRVDVCVVGTRSRPVAPARLSRWTTWPWTSRSRDSTANHCCASPRCVGGGGSAQMQRPRRARLVDARRTVARPLPARAPYGRTTPTGVSPRGRRVRAHAVTVAGWTRRGAVSGVCVGRVCVRRCVLSATTRRAAVGINHALDDAFAWLDAESLLHATVVCRRWAERTTRDGVWRGRVVEVGWGGRGARAGTTPTGARSTCARVPAPRRLRDDRPATRTGPDAVRRRRLAGLCPAVRPCEFAAGARTVHLYDAAAARTAGTLPVGSPPLLPP